MKIKIKVKCPGKGKAYVNLRCSPAELKDILAAGVKSDKHLRKNQKKIKDM